jgi:ferredoxin
MSLFGKKQKETYISYAGDTHQVSVPIYDSVMEGAIKNGIDGIVAECGGACQCATCHVYVGEAFLGLLNRSRKMRTRCSTRRLLSGRRTAGWAARYRSLRSSTA